MTERPGTSERRAAELWPAERFRHDGREWISDRVAVTTGQPVTVLARRIEANGTRGAATELTIAQDVILLVRDGTGAAGR